MYYDKYFITLCCFLILFNCKDEHKTTFLDVNITTDENTIVQVNIPQATGVKTISNEINSEIQKTIISALHIGDSDKIIFSSIEESITSFNNEYNAFKSDFPELAQPWEAQIDGEVIYKSPELISIAITSFTSTGGAHGILNISFLNFDSKTGQHLQNDQLFKDMEALKKLVEPYFKEATKDKSLLLDYKEFQLPTNIAYSEDGIVLLYNTQEITPYSDGIVEFAIPFEDIKSYLVFNSL